MSEIQSHVIRSADNVTDFIKKKFPGKRIDRTETDGKITIESPIDYSDVIDRLEEEGGYAEVDVSENDSICYDDQFNAWVMVFNVNIVYETITRFKIS